MTEAAGPLEAVEGQLAAYNARDIEAFAAWFAEDVELFRLGESEPFVRGRAQLVERYGPMFASRPDLHAAIVHRAAHGRFVTDEEEVRGLDPEGGLVRALAIYEGAGREIRRVWFVR
ncbi:MAG: nuclear transport factor 2 family protein [Planctomycetota bacterium]|nr:nuclear transport factor 2 family protein [Planctomycetota bacterium]MCB9899979.1 nuclear transport factor 2 family protein [Planctomycetota bacterium]